jgi:hypothetical protein
LGGDCAAEFVVMFAFERDRTFELLTREAEPEAIEEATPLTLVCAKADAAAPPPLIGITEVMEDRTAAAAAPDSSICEAEERRM